MYEPISESHRGIINTEYAHAIDYKAEWGDPTWLERRSVRLNRRFPWQYVFLEWLRITFIVLPEKIFPFLSISLISNNKFYANECESDLAFLIQALLIRNLKSLRCKIFKIRNAIVYVVKTNCERAHFLYMYVSTRCFVIKALFWKESKEVGRVIYDLHLSFSRLKCSAFYFCSHFSRFPVKVPSLTTRN